MASRKAYPMNMATTKKVNPKKMARPAMMSTKCSISMAMGVFSFPTPLARLAIRPMMVRSPVLMITPVATPARRKRTEIHSLPEVFFCCPCSYLLGVSDVVYPPGRLWRRMQCFSSPGGFHEYIQESWLVVQTPLSRTSCPPGVGIMISLHLQEELKCSSLLLDCEDTRCVYLCDLPCIPDP